MVHLEKKNKKMFSIILFLRDVLIPQACSVLVQHTMVEFFVLFNSASHRTSNIGRKISKSNFLPPKEMQDLVNSVCY